MRPNTARFIFVGGTLLEAARTGCLDRERIVTRRLGAFDVSWLWRSQVRPVLAGKQLFLAVPVLHVPSGLLAVRT